MKTQIKFFANPSLISIEDMVNEWLEIQCNSVDITIVSITELTQVKQPTFMLIYKTVANAQAVSNVFNFESKVAQVN